MTAAIALGWAVMMGVAGAEQDTPRNSTDSSKRSAEEQEAKAADDQAESMCRDRRYDEAIGFFQEGLGLREKLYGKNSLELIASLDRLAFCQQMLQDFDAAESLLTRALEIREQRLGPMHRSTAISLRNLGDLKRSRGEFNAARPLLEKALEIRDRVLGPDHPLTAESLHDMAALFHDQDRYTEAEDFYKRALAIRIAQGAEEPGVISTVAALARLYRETDREETAERLEGNPAGFIDETNRKAGKGRG